MLLIVLAVGVLILAVVAALGLDVQFDRSAILPLTLAFLISLTAPLLSAIEYKLSLRLTGADSDSRSALQLSVFASIANVLPLPGGLAIKLKGMTEHGAQVRRAVGAALLTGLIWLSLSAAALALALPSYRSEASIAAALLLAGSVTSLAMGRFRIVPAAQLVIVESLFVVSAATRFYLVLDAIGVVRDPIDSMALAASGSLASTLGIVPGALGVFEALSAGLALIIGLPAGAGLLGAVVLRVLLFGSLLLWSVVLGVRRPGARRR
jgi:hypothetical protein